MSWKDEEFDNPYDLPGPTKEEIRALTLAKADVEMEDRVADVGCGTGAIAIEAARLVGPKGRVFAIDFDSRAVETTMINVRKFGMEGRVKIIKGDGVEVLRSGGLSPLDAIMIGGSWGKEGGREKRVEELISSSRQALSMGGRIVVNCVTLETGFAAFRSMKSLFDEVDATLAIIAKGKELGSSTLMIARNPVLILCSVRSEDHGK
jgi:precorrin-6Y C5,15-methyltransferase (decarboxylating) CbiT subunit